MGEMTFNLIIETKCHKKIEISLSVLLFVIDYKDNFVFASLWLPRRKFHIKKIKNKKKKSVKSRKNDSLPFPTLISCALCVSFIEFLP